MTDVEIWHNPKCTKSRQTLKLLQEKGVDPKVVNYLETPPSRTRLKAVLNLLSMTPRDFMRKKEKPFRDLSLDDPSLSDDQLIDAMVANPILIERPVVIKGSHAAIGRPPENVLPLIA